MPVSSTSRLALGKVGLGATWRAARAFCAALDLDLSQRTWLGAMSLSLRFLMTREGVGEVLGVVSTVCVILQYLPQTIHNHRRHSVDGFSASSMCVKSIGASFLFVNALVMKEPIAVILYGLVNIVQMDIFACQIAFYRRKRIYLSWFFLPLVPWALASLWPASVGVTYVAKPIAQVVSHVPQLVLCVRERSTRGVSMSTQHLNFGGGVAGLLMLWLLRRHVSFWSYMLYVNSMLQALTLYACYFVYSNRAGGGDGKVKTGTSEDMVVPFGRHEDVTGAPRDLEAGLVTQSGGVGVGSAGTSAGGGLPTVTGSYTLELAASRMIPEDGGALVRGVPTPPAAAAVAVAVATSGVP